VRAGRRAGTRTVVLHVLVDGAAADDPARVGFVVSRGVGGAVVRNRVRRRLRHLVRERLAELPRAAVVVVRANPAAAEASYDELRADLGRCLERVVIPTADQPHPAAAHS
jgi:ribonuclease P protein component